MSKKPQRSARSVARGFTLIELMAVLVILSIVLTVVLPGFATLSERTKLKSYANEFVTSVVLARGEAIKRNARVDLCVAPNPSSPVCATSGNWEEGWMVKDPNSPDIVRYQQALSSDLQLFDLSSASFSLLSFDSRGLGSSSRQFKLCKPDGIEVKQISVSTTGRTRIETCPSTNCDCNSTVCVPSACGG